MARKPLFNDNLDTLVKERENNTPEIPVADIEVGTRHRHDMGDIDALAQNIAEIGLLHPIVVTPAQDGRSRLIAGARRLLAYRKLGRERIPATVLDLHQIVRGEYAENFFRKAFTPSEFADIADALEPLERQAAKERQKEAGQTKAPGKFPQARGAALDHVARAIGKDRKTIAKAREVRDAAKADPARFGKLAADMDRTGHVDGPFRRLNIARQAEAICAEPPPYPSPGPYRVIVADPPWPYEVDKEDPSQRATHPYPQMSIDAICAEAPSVAAIAHDDCVLRGLCRSSKGAPRVWRGDVAARRLARGLNDRVPLKPATLKMRRLPETAQATRQNLCAEVLARQSRITSHHK
jgi:ParB-like nuclease domain